MAIPANAPHPLKIRKLMFSQLEVACADLNNAGLIEWPNETFDKSVALTENGGPGAYLKPTMHPTDERARTMGPNPRVQNDGFMRVGIHTEPGIGQDLAEIIEGQIRAGFPYSVPLTRDGLSIEITRRLSGTATPIDSWYYLPVSIYWTLWRAT